MRHLFLSFILFSYSILFQNSQEGALPHKNGVYMIIHTPEVNKKYPAILAIGGSEGGYAFNKRMADSFAKMNFVFARLAYFKAENTNLPSTLEEIPLEYFENALDSLLKHPQVDSSKIGVMCISKGTEAGLHLASVRREVKALAAHVPSHVYWYGLSKSKGSKKASWTYKNKPVPYVPYGKPENGWFAKNICEYYEAGIKKYSSREKEAAIKVENMKCHLLLTSGTEDKMWPSAYMAGKIMHKLEQSNYPFYTSHESYKNAGHGIYRTPLPEHTYPEYLEKLGGEKEANIQAINHNWENTMFFFNKYLANE